MYFLVLSHFDSIIGPTIFLAVPEFPSQEILEEIPRQMDSYSEGFFIYEYGELKTSNLIFTIPSPNARGREETLMISIVISNDVDSDLKVYQSTLEQFVHELQIIENNYKVFNRDTQNLKDGQEIYKKVKDLLNSVYNALPKETISTEKREINLVMFDFYDQGESQIAQHFRNFISKTEDLNLLHYKITISTYPIYNRKKSINFFLSQLKNKHGFIFVIDMTNKTMLRKARHISNKIIRLAIGKLNIVNMPCLILINQNAISRFESKKILRFLDDYGYDVKKVKYIPPHTTNQDEIQQAFNWILNRIISKKLKFKK